MIQIKAERSNFFNNSLEKMSLRTFIILLDDLLTKENLVIVNGDNFITKKELRARQQEIQEQQDQLQKFGILCGAVQGLMLLQEDPNRKNFCVSASADKVLDYYSQVSKITRTRKKCTCDGLVAVALTLAIDVIKEKSIDYITIDICSLRNWSHALLRITTTLAEAEKILFYDPWYQRCYTNNPSEPKIVSPENLGLEMEALIAKAIMIEPAEFFIDLERDGKQVVNSDRDFSYFVACSNHKFETPSPVTKDPTVRPKSWCNLI